MKIYAFLLSCLLISASAHAKKSTQKEVTQFLNNLSGTYTLINAQEDKSSKFTCPQTMDVQTFAEERRLAIINHDMELNPEYPNANITNFSSIGLKRTRMGDDMFTYTDSRYHIYNIEGGQALLYETRPCGGVIFVKCGKYTWNKSFIKTDNNTVVISINPKAHVFGYGGFPMGSCEYQK